MNRLVIFIDHTPVLQAYPHKFVGCPLLFAGLPARYCGVGPQNYVLWIDMPLFIRSEMTSRQPQPSAMQKSKPHQTHKFTQILEFQPKILEFQPNQRPVFPAHNPVHMKSPVSPFMPRIIIAIINALRDFTNTF